MRNRAKKYYVFSSQGVRTHYMPTPLRRTPGKQLKETWRTGGQEPTLSLYLLKSGFDEVLG